jgi:flagellar motor switch protein FliG
MQSKMEHTPAVVEPNSVMSNTQKAAILIASLPEHTAANILQRLAPTSLRLIAEAIKNLGMIPSEVGQRVITECMKGITETQGSLTVDETTANKLLKQAIGEKRATALLQETPTNSAPFPSLEGISAEQLLSVLGREKPSIIATVLRYLSPEFAGDVLNQLPPEISKRVMVILCTGRPPSEEVVKHVQSYIESKLGKRKTTETLDVGDQVERASSVLQILDHDLVENILQAIDENSPDLGTELRDRLFKFDDIIRINDIDMRRIMQEINMESLTLALRTAPVDVREKFFSNMSRRAAEGIKEDMQYAPKVKLSDVEAKQKEIIAIIRDLDGQGEISIREGSGNEYV